MSHRKNKVPLSTVPRGAKCSIFGFVYERGALNPGLGLGPDTYALRHPSPKYDYFFLPGNILVEYPIVEESCEQLSLF